MYRIGIDIGSTYTKYCVFKDGLVSDLFTERTPLRQREYFDQKTKSLLGQYPGARIVSCGHGKKNAFAEKQINELTALALGSYFVTGKDAAVLDIGGQDTKVILQRGGRLTEFFVNEKCAAGCGIFLENTASLLHIDPLAFDLRAAALPEIRLSAVCAVFAQTEIVELLSDNVSPDEIFKAVLVHIINQAKNVVGKVSAEELLLSGGLTQIKCIDSFAGQILGRNLQICSNASYLSAIGCCMYDG